MVEQQAGRLGQQAEGPHLKLQARGREGEVGMARIFKVANPASGDISSNKVTGAKPPQTVPSSGDQAFKSLRLWVTTHPNHRAFSIIHIIPKIKGKPKVEIKWHLPLIWTTQEHSFCCFD